MQQCLLELPRTVVDRTMCLPHSSFYSSPGNFTIHFRLLWQSKLLHDKAFKNLFMWTFAFYEFFQFALCPVDISSFAEAFLHSANPVVTAYWYKAGRDRFFAHIAYFETRAEFKFNTGRTARITFSTSSRFRGTQTWRFFDGVHCLAFDRCIYQPTGYRMFFNRSSNV